MPRHVPTQSLAADSQLLPAAQGGQQPSRSSHLMVKSPNPATAITFYLCGSDRPLTGHGCCTNRNEQVTIKILSTNTSTGKYTTLLQAEELRSVRTAGPACPCQETKMFSSHNQDDASTISEQISPICFYSGTIPIEGRHIKITDSRR